MPILINIVQQYTEMDTIHAMKGTRRRDDFNLSSDERRYPGIREAWPCLHAGVLEHPSEIARCDGAESTAHLLWRREGPSAIVGDLSAEGSMRFDACGAFLPRPCLAPVC